jgi:hypothetical protein
MQLQSEPESGGIALAATATANVQERTENVVFEDEATDEIENVSTLLDVSYGESSDNAAALADYLSRPVKIDEFTWNESDSFTTSPRTIRPWLLYFNNVYIKKKVENFARIQCKLKLTFRFNASPFYYGMMRACYDPMATGKFSPVSGFDLIPLSQTHGIDIAPQSNSSAVLELPFLWPNSWLDVTNVQEFTNMGLLMFLMYSNLKSANGVSSAGITVTTYAEAVDVVLAAPTTYAALQSGIISGPATAVTGLAKSFTNSPSIGPYARAVSVGAAAVASIAKMFGYSNPPVTSNVQPVQNKTFHAFANVETSVPLDKLAVDPSNEVTIDTRVAGVDGEDELAITTLITKPSYLGVVSWTQADTPGTKLYSISVTPTPGIEEIQTSQVGMYHTPASFVGRFFRFWRGTMRYRFRIIRTQYHKGRLILSWDPSGNVATSGVETAVFTKIFDLASEEEEIIFDVPYKATQPWLNNKFNLGSFIARSSATFDDTEHNGVLSMGVQNALTGPAATSTLDILVYSQALEDMQYSAPQVLPPHVTSFSVQSEAIDGSSLSYGEHIPEITVGERVASLRTLLHRATMAFSTQPGISPIPSDTMLPGLYLCCNKFDRIPPCWGFDPNGINYAASVVTPANHARMNYAPTHPINFVLTAFVGYRGSTVHHVVIKNNGCEISDLGITRTWDSKDMNLSRPITNANYKLFTSNLGSSWMSKLASDTYGNGVAVMAKGHAGKTLTQTTTQAACSAVIPQYAPARFYPAWAPKRDVIPDSATTPTHLYDGFRVDMSVEKTGSTDLLHFPTFDLYTAAGVDFTTVFFTGVPRLYRYDVPTPYVSLP